MVTFQKTWRFLFYYYYYYYCSCACKRWNSRKREREREIKKDGKILYFYLISKMDMIMP